MKKIILLALLAFVGCLSTRSFATITFTLVSNPCDTNKVLAISFTGAGTIPYRTYWAGGTYSGWDYNSGVIIQRDTIFHYAGAPVKVTIYDSVSAIIDSGSYAGLSANFSISYPPVAPFCSLTASASVTVTGGTPPYTYSWYRSWAGPVVSVATGNPVTLPAGIYGTFITDAAGCTGGSMQGPYDTLRQVPTYTFSVTTTAANCTNGTASAVLSSGFVPPLSYAWSTGATSPSVSGLTMGSYNLTTTDALGCMASGTGYVNQAITINVNTTATPATCLASDGAIIGFGSGGVSPYTYLWSNGSTLQSQTGLPAGPYNLTVTDANGCIGTTSNYISSSTPVIVTFSATPSLCTAPTGTATLSISGGTPPYADTFYTAPLQTAVTATNLAPGTYQFRVVDAVGCVRTGAVTVPPINIIVPNFSQVAALCTLSNGSMNVAPTGGTTPYTYSWSTGATTPGISSKPSGYYHVTITDNSSCKITASQYLGSTSPVTAGLSSVPASCLFANDGSATVTGIGGTAPYVYSWSNGGTTATVSSLKTGPYWVSVTDVSGCTNPNRYTYVGYNTSDSSCFCVIKGTVYLDANGNCTQDAGEAGIQNIQLYCSGIGYTYTNAAGEYSFLVPAGSYTIKQTILAYYPLSPCQVNNIPVTTSAGAGCVHVIDFADAMNPIHDITVSTWDYNKPVPGNTYHQTYIVTNKGTVTESNILGGYNTDGQIFTPTYLPSTIYTAGTPTWYSTTGGSGLSLAPGASMHFYLDYNVPTFIPMGTDLVFKDSVAYAAPMTNWLTDYSPWNNVNYFTTPVVSSYDPNFVEVYPKGAGVNGNITYADSVLTYMVHFQNTGTYKAQNIEVIDTLDPNLDWSTLSPVSATAACKVTLSTNGVLKYMFKDINLPAEMNDAVGSNGMFTYTIKTKPAMPMNTQFKNRASIYFDYNAPILTNTTVNTLWWLIPTMVEQARIAYSTFTIYPNPASQAFTAILNNNNAGNAIMSITDISGKELMSKGIAIQKGVQTINTDIAGFAAGIYFVTINDHGKTQTQKLVIMK